MPSARTSTLESSSFHAKPSAEFGTASGRTGSEDASREGAALSGVSDSVELTWGRLALASSGDASTASMSMPGSNCVIRFSRFPKRFSTLDKYLTKHQLRRLDISEGRTNARVNGDRTIFPL